MKLSLYALIAPLLATSALAQSIAIGAPTASTSVSPGSKITIQVDRPNSLTGSQEVAIVIALNPCESSPCTSPSEELGRVLYTGSFNPQYDSPPDRLPPHQNFTVQVPTDINSGNALLSVTHLSLVGASPFPLFEIKNVTVNIA